MEMKVPHRLSAVVSTVDDGAVAVAQSFLLGQLPGHHEQVPHQVRVLRIEVVERRDGLAGNDKDVRGRLRVDVPKGDTSIILVDDVGVFFTVDYALKNGFLGHGTDPRVREQNGANGLRLRGRVFAITVAITI